MAWKPPSTWIIEPVVAGNQSDSSATVDRATAEESSTSQPSGARSSHILELGEARDRLGGHRLDRAGSDELARMP